MQKQQLSGQKMDCVSTTHGDNSFTTLISPGSDKVDLMYLQRAYVRTCSLESNTGLIFQCLTQTAIRSCRASSPTTHELTSVTPRTNRSTACLRVDGIGRDLEGAAEISRSSLSLRWRGRGGSVTSAAQLMRSTYSWALKLVVGSEKLLTFCSCFPLSRAARMCRNASVQLSQSFSVTMAIRSCSK